MDAYNPADNPHETDALVRMYDLGWPMPEISKTLGMSITKVMEGMRKGLDEREDAKRHCRPVHA